jgi:hypothetical protein
MPTSELGWGTSPDWLESISLEEVNAFQKQLDDVLSTLRNFAKRM